jgi:hypothetical protein
MAGGDIAASPLLSKLDGKYIKGDWLQGVGKE